MAIEKPIRLTKAEEREALVDYLALGIEEALDRYPLINLERGEYDAIAGTAAQACVDAGFVPTASAERVAELEREHAALAATVERIRTSALGLLKSLREVEERGDLYDAATHRWADLLHDELDAAVPEPALTPEATP